MMDTDKIGQIVNPVNGQLVLVRDTESDTNKAGLYVGEEASRKLRSGIVVRTAEDCTLPVKAGQRVGYQRHAGSDMRVMVEGENYDIVLMPQGSVTMILEGDAKLGVRDD